MPSTVIGKKVMDRLEKIDEVEESVAIGQLWPPDKPTDTRVVLFVRLRAGLTLDEALTEKIKELIQGRRLRVDRRLAAVAAAALQG